MSENYGGHSLSKSASSGKMHNGPLATTATSISALKAPPTRSMTQQYSTVDSVTSNNDILSKVKIYADLENYENVLTKFVTSIDTFKPDIDIAKALIDVDQSLSNNLDLFIDYDEVDIKLTELNDESEKLDLRTKNILEILNECRSSLNSLPMLEQVQLERDMIYEKRKKINSKALLDYATKISKFTKIPPTFNKGSVGPNNFIWPAEDALRRGMLALASLHSKELTRLTNDATCDTENEEENIQESDTNLDATKLGQNNNIEDQPDESDNKDFFVFDGSHKQEGNFEEASDNDNMDLDLDLFNPDEF